MNENEAKNKVKIGGNKTDLGLGIGLGIGMMTALGAEPLTDLEPGMAAELSVESEDAPGQRGGQSEHLVDSYCRLLYDHIEFRLEKRFNNEQDHEILLVMMESLESLIKLFEFGGKK